MSNGSVCDIQALISMEMALKQLLESVSPLSEVEWVATAYAAGRNLAETVHSAINVPPYDNSAMDGFAVKAEELTIASTLALVGTSYAGKPYDGVVNSGECVRVMTGAMIPSGTNAVIMQEQAQVDEQQVGFTVTTQPGANIRSVAEDIHSGQVVLIQGRRLTAADCGLLASLGIDKVCVYRALRVAIFASGDELKTAGESLDYGQIYESNRVALMAMLRRLGVDLIDFGIIPDDLQQLRATFDQADAQADVVISSGGVSVGEADLIRVVLAEKGQVSLWRLAIKPGKPFTFGRLATSYFLGLPGNPVSSLVTFHQLAVPFLRSLAGQTDVAPLRFQAMLTADIDKRPGRMEFQRGIFSHVNGQAQVRNTGHQGSGMLSSMSKANCYIVLERERGNIQSGEMVTIELFDELLV